MSIPGFGAAASLRRGPGRYAGRAAHSGQGPASVIPAIPFCGNCDWILDNCAVNGWRPRAACNACAVGNCFSGVEDPTPEDPFTPSPLDTF